MNIEKLNTKARQEIIRKIANYLLEIAEEDDERYLDDDEVGLLSRLLVENFVKPLSNEDYFGTEGWEHFFGLG